MSDERTASVPVDVFPSQKTDRCVGRRSRVKTEWVRTARSILLVAIALYASAFAVRAYVRKYLVFLPDYARWTTFGAAPLSPVGPTHVFVIMADHFEPKLDARLVSAWAARYARLAAQHRDADGRPPQHTWFYPGEQPSPAIMRTLGALTAAGLGEVELHFHHANDSADSLRRQLQTAIEEFHQFGFLQTIDGKTAFAFVHGNSGLDNSNGDAHCGVNEEITLLQSLGGFADFTFPSLYEDSQPRRVNSIYATRDDAAAKSYDRVLPVRSLRDGTAQLLIFEGPLIFSPSTSLRHLFLDLDDGDIHAAEHASPRRADRWVRANVHVDERPDWVFVKLFAHGASSPDDAESVLGADYDETLRYLEQTYNDGATYVLHYVTAREAYNLARAAADGATGNPAQYRDSYIGRYRSNSVPAVVDTGSF